MKRLKVYIPAILILTAGFSAVPSARGEEVKPSFDMIREYYERGEYDKAIGAYKGYFEKGLESGPLCYNIGNCYLQKGGSIGEAIFFYKTAERFIPRDTDLLVNLRYARSLVKQENAPPDEFWMLRILRMAFDRFTIKEAFTLWNGCYFGCAVFFVLSLFIKKLKGVLRFAVVLFFCITILMIIPLRAKIYRDEKAGVIIAAAADARFEPFEDASPKFPLYKGMEISVIKTTGEWYKIKSPDGKVGWVSPKAVMRRIPTAQVNLRGCRMY